MLLRTTIGMVRITFSLAKIAKIMGINSRLEDGTHILMWDFDKLELASVAAALKVVQSRYLLSDIHILETNREEKNHIAYCFTRTEWQRAIEILSATYGVDWQFIRLSVYRGWFTLRVGAKKSGVPRIVRRLEGFCLPDVEPSELASWVEYETLDRS